MMKTSIHIKLIIILLGISIVLLQGCASVPMADLNEDADAKEFMPLRDKASIYIYRNEIFGAAIPLTVLINGKKLGQTASKTYFKVSVLPGEYEIESVSENTSSLKILVEAARNYFVWQEVKMGMWMARSLLQQVDEEKGRAGVEESKLIKPEVSKVSPLGVDGADNVAHKLRELNELRKEGVINEEEFQTKKRQLLKGL